MFGRIGKDKAAGLRDVVCLDHSALPPQGKSWAEVRYAAVMGGMESRARLGVCAALNRRGELLTRPAQVLSLVRARLARGSRVPPDCDRERVERPYSGDTYGGSFSGGDTPFDSNEVMCHLLVPWEAEDIETAELARRVAALAAQDRAAELRRLGGRAIPHLAALFGKDKFRKTILPVLVESGAAEARKVIEEALAATTNTDDIFMTARALGVLQRPESKKALLAKIATFPRPEPDEGGIALAATRGRTSPDHRRPQRGRTSAASAGGSTARTPVDASAEEVGRVVVRFSRAQVGSERHNSWVCPQVRRV